MADEVPAQVVEAMRKKPVFPQRFGQPEEFANLVLSICQTPMLNGTTIRLDAGIRLEPR